MIIDLRSDTVTQPSAGMKEAMMQAVTGDDVFGEDPTVNALEARVAAMFGHEAALFCASGTMANQIAVKVQTRGMDEIIAHELCHIYYYETGGYAFHSGVSIKLGRSADGILTPEEVRKNIQPDYDWLPRTSLVTIENTCNKGGGTCYEFDTMADIAKICKEHSLAYHLDGARLFNALAERSYTISEIGPLFTSISICFSKGLGSPVGSMLIGSRELIRNARRVRKVFGGGMRQVGLLAAACNYALDHNVSKLPADHDRARRIGRAVSQIPQVEHVRPVSTNILLFDLKPDIDRDQFLQTLDDAGVKMIAFGPHTVRAVTHLDITDEHIHHVEETLKNVFL